MGSGLDILEPISNRRIVRARCDPSSIFVDGTNNLSVKIDPSGALKKDVSLGLDVKIDPSGVIKNDPAVGLDVKVDPTGGLKKDVGLGLDVITDPTGSVKVDPGLGLDTRLHPTGAIENIPTMGLKWKTDPLGPLFCDLAGADIKLAPNSALSKSTLGLTVDVDESGVVTKDVLGLDV
ncbi:hypothetical protein HK097_008884 [Rhizophlyctis rosea]|uniref:Uncharacterized protein n=1 Tax=Rhizophlyctis rosea TaxID=64517 RepID=A0AAD5SI08_9FUNG|nr:hypothetical protein HK097_008884 [Rhizophlyctis rosea]